MEGICERRRKKEEIIIHATPIAYVNTIPLYSATITHLLECNCGSDEMASVDSVVFFSVSGVCFVKIIQQVKRNSETILPNKAVSESKVANYK